MTFCTLSISHLPRSSRAVRAFAHEPMPSPSSVRARTKSHSRFPGISALCTRCHGRREATYSAVATALWGRLRPAPRRGRPWLDAVSMAPRRGAGHVLLERRAPSSLLKYSPRASTRVSSFNSPFFSPGPASVAPRRRGRRWTTYASRWLGRRRWRRSCRGHSPADTAGCLTCSRRAARGF